MSPLLLLLLFYTLSSCNTNVKGEIPEFVVEEDEEVLLSCPVNTPECGEYHSLKWYRDANRVYVYSPIALFSNAEGALMDRCFDLSQTLGPDCKRGSLSVTDSAADLRISPIKLTDDGEYRCEITYLDVSNNCPVVHLTNVRTVAPPAWATVSVSADQSQPFPAGSVISVSCISGGGKPRPSFSWRLGGEELLGHSEEGDELEARSEVSFTVEEEHAGLEIECLVENEASVEPLKDQFRLEVEVPVKTVRLDLETVAGREGEEMTVKCSAVGGPPTPHITWTLPHDVPHLTTNLTTVLEDDSLETVSHLTFTPSFLQDMEVIQCHAINDVMTEAITYEALLDIEYPPRVTISPENVTLLQGSEESLECHVTSNPANVTVKWFHQQQELDIEGEERFSEDLTDPETFLLVISNSSAADSGEYSCSASNYLGSGTAETSAIVDVLFPPSVSVSSERGHIISVSEGAGDQLTLSCNLETGHPEELLSVTWYRDDQPLLSSPFVECEVEEEFSLGEMGVEQCEGRGQSQVTLQDVERSEAGLYSCVGSNSAGEGEMSPSVQIIVHYLPGDTQLLQTEEFITKGSSANFACLVEENGNPESEIFLWKLGDTILEEISQNLTLTNIGFESQQNLSCAAVNEIGAGESDSLQISVFAPPSFIEALPDTMNVLSDDPDFVITCQVECDPVCDVVWLKDDLVVEAEDEMFEIIEEVVPEDFDNNVFMSVKSTIRKHSNISFDRTETNLTFSCQVSDHQFGDFISSSSLVFIQYPPEDVTVGEENLEVMEGEELEPVLCSGSGSPQLTFYWTLRDEVVAEGDLLTFHQPLTRTQAGQYLCHGANRHGEQLAALNLSVLYRPQCSLTYTFEEDEIVLLCQASANPNDLTFWWDKGNESYVGDSEEAEGTSSLRIKIQNESLGDYICYVNNSVGESDPCSIQTQDILLKKEVSEQELVLIIAVVSTVLVLLLLLALATCYYLYRKGNKANVNSDKKEKNDEQPRSDKSFYENLPFEGLKRSTIYDDT